MKVAASAAADNVKGGFPTRSGRFWPIRCVPRKGGQQFRGDRLGDFREEASIDETVRMRFGTADGRDGVAFPGIREGFPDGGGGQDRDAGGDR
jgi:hypothetical protein